MISLLVIQLLLHEMLLEAYSSHLGIVLNLIRAYFIIGDYGLVVSER